MELVEAVSTAEDPSFFNLLPDKIGHFACWVIFHFIFWYILIIFEKFFNLTFLVANILFQDQD